MKSPGPVVAVSALALFAVLAVAWSALVHRLIPVADPPRGPASVSGGGVTLVSDRIALPDAASTLPELLEARCTACHSGEMLTTQPPLSRDQWQASLDKMRTVYKAPLPAGEDAALIDALLTLPAQRVGTGSSPE